MPRFALALVLTLTAAPASAQTSMFVARADGFQENPSVSTSAYGVTYGHYDATGDLTVTMQHNVTGATAAHVHRGGVGTNGGVVQGFPSAGSPATVSFTPTAAQRTALAGDPDSDGLYVNIHSGAHSGGEIRAQIIGLVSPPQVYINEIMYDPVAGSEGVGLDTNGDGTAATPGAQMDDEFVEIVNGTPATVDIGGWTITDAARVRHTFGLGTTLPPFGAIVVFGGGDLTAFNAGPATGVLATNGQLGLSNGGDTVTLFDDGGTPIDQVIYASGDADGESLTRRYDTIASGSIDAHSTAQARIGGFAFPVTTHSPGMFSDATFYFAAATASVCGDGDLDGGEACDEGMANGDASCCTELCELKASGDPCDDGLFCTATDTCDGSGTCTGAGAACDDGVDCTTDVCDESTDSCSETLVDAMCDDGDPCNGDETCSASGCVDGTDLVCDDSDACTSDSCDSSSGCVFVADLCDAGVDAGPPGSDAGLDADAGVTLDDAGVAIDDGGVTDDDAGVTDDDAGATLTDAGATGGDAGMSADAGVVIGTDGGTSGVDAGTGRDDGGCSCRAAGARDGRAPLALIGLLAAVWIRRRVTR